MGVIHHGNSQGVVTRNTTRYIQEHKVDPTLYVLRNEILITITWLTAGMDPIPWINYVVYLDLFPLLFYISFFAPYIGVLWCAPSPSTFTAVCIPAASGCLPIAT